MCQPAAEWSLTNPYLELTGQFNHGRLRALLSSGQAVVAYRLAIMSKDGDWILREDGEAVDHVLNVLAGHGARYRFGAPLDIRWLAGGWSSHFELSQSGLRLRADFVTRPPRVSDSDRRRLWTEAESGGCDVVDLEALARLKMTRREKDWAVIGELARQMEAPSSQLLFSRSSRDLLRIAEEHPGALPDAIARRPLLARIQEGRAALEEALDRERRDLMRADEERLARYSAAAEGWAQIWPDVSRQIAGLPLGDAHRLLTSRAEGVLPTAPETGGGW